jgi:FKBP-type peptidyl-prolyl cis-trans isomerase SlpA
MITIGQTVTVNYTGRVEDGEVFDTTEGSEPHKFTLGKDPLMQGFVDAILGKEVGDKFTVNIPKEKAFGDYDNEKIKEIPKGYMPGEVVEEQILIARGANGEEAKIIVKEVHDDHVVIDGNHPLAGMDVIFDIEIVDAI